MTTDLDLPRLLEVALHAARAGGEVVRDAFGAARDIRSKGPGDWVSATDTASDAEAVDAEYRTFDFASWAALSASLNAPIPEPRFGVFRM